MRTNGENCRFVKKTGLRPFKRCLYCDKNVQDCFGFQFFVVVLGIIGLLLVMFTIRDLPILAIEITIIILLMLSFLGYIASKETNEIVLTNHLLKELNFELEKRVSQRTKELKLLNFDLQKALRIKSDFLRNMSHELKTPLATILGYISIIAEKQAGEINEKQSKMLDAMKKNGNDLLHLINQLLDLSKSETGSLGIEEKDYNLNRTISEATVNIGYMASKKNISITVKSDEKISSIFADHERIKQILVNLLSNAVKFSKNGSEVEVETKDEGGHILVSVKDSGIGIAREDFKSIFEPFKQLAPEISSKYGGTGVGLSIVKSLVEAYGGKVTVESSPGKGSIFAFTIPKKKS
ncbi:MAG: HAMP domain-containing sensor histidine kinase [Candidatus Margulisiibacteriota bacterium]